MPCWQNNGGSSSARNSSTSLTSGQSQGGQSQGSQSSVSSVARSLLPTRRRLKLDPPNNLYFPYEPGKQVRSAINIKNTSKSHVAFKFETTAPKRCFMHPPGAIIEKNEKLADQKSKDKFKITSLEVKGSMEYVPEMQLEKLKRQLAEAEAALEARKKPPENSGPRNVGEGLVIDEWKERRERYLARQQVEGVDSV